MDDNYGYYGDVQHWGNNGEESLGGLGDTTTAAVTNSPSWLDSITSVLAPLAVGFEQSQTAAVAKATGTAPATSSTLNTSTLITWGAIGLGAILLISMMGKKRR